MGISEDGYFGLDIDGSTLTMKYINVSLSGIALFLQVTIGIMAIRQMLQKQNMEHIHWTSNTSFLFSLCCACSCTVSLIIWHILDPADPPLVVFTYFLSIGCFFISLLGILIIRLHLTFKTSIYRMSSLLSCSFILILSILLIALIGICVVFLMICITLSKWLLFTNLSVFLTFC